MLHIPNNNIRIRRKKREIITCVKERLKSENKQIKRKEKGTKTNLL